MPKQILWLDNDPREIAPYVNVLKAESYLVTVVTTVTEAEVCLRENRYDLLILDVMIPTKNATEEERYPPFETDHGHSAELLFYQGEKSVLKGAGTQILVLTQRIDARIKDSFLEAGLPVDAFATKYDLRDVDDFLIKVRELMSKRILWLDNDLAQIAHYVDVLRVEGYLVTVVATVTEAEVSLRENRYDLLILDVMIPTKNATEEERYPPFETDHGHSTGLLFYQGEKSVLEGAGTQILVLTQRIDARIKDSFLEAGLPVDAFTTKYVLRDVDDFLIKVKGILRAT